MGIRLPRSSARPSARPLPAWLQRRNQAPAAASSATRADGGERAGPAHSTMGGVVYGSRLHVLAHQARS